MSRAQPSAIIIGAGMTGIQLAIKLREQGITDLVILEKADSVGGTWRENTYPGVACDVPGHAYTYSFAPNPEWSRMFAPGDEIHRYFITVAQRYGIDQLIRFNEAATECRYQAGRWTVASSQAQTYEADFLFAATGILHEPVLPDIPGRDRFAGVAMHSARWNHQVDLSNKRIGVIGTGSSSAQLTPELINMAGTEVTVFQRTPHWLIRVADKAYSARDIQRFRDKPKAIQRVRNIALAIYEQGTTILTEDSWWARILHRLAAWNARGYLRRTVTDPELRAQLTPDYTFGCKRVVMNDTFYTAIQQDNAHLVTEGIRQIEADGIRTEDGHLHPLDAIVYATGFNPTAYMRSMPFIGKDGLSIKQAWQHKIQAYRSLCIPGFPNFFLMLGPNSPIGNYSVIAMSEQQADYALQLIDHWRNGALDTIEARPEAMRTWNTMLRAKMQHTVWASGCQSWYLDADGDPLTWPDTWKQWLAAMATPELADFVTPHQSHSAALNTAATAGSELMPGAISSP